MDPVEYLRALRGRWPIIAAAVGLALAAAWFTTTTVVPVGRPGPPTFRATALLLSTNTSAGSPGLSTMAALTTIEPVADRAAEAIAYEGDPLDLAGNVSAVADSSAGILRISATDLSPQRAELMANEFSKALLDHLRERRTESSSQQASALQKQLDRLSRQIADLDRRIATAPEGGSESELLTSERNAKVFAYSTVSQQLQQVLAEGRASDPLEFIQDAVARPVQRSTGFQPPQSPTSRLVLGGVVGLLGGAAVALLLERLNTTIRSREAAEAHFRLPVLAEIPVLSRRQRGTIAIAEDPSSAVAEATRLLAAGVEQGPATGWLAEATDNGERKRSRPQTIMVTSPAPSDGKTSLVANLSAAYAEMGRRVLVLSCDFRHPEIHEFFGLSLGRSKGLAGALRSSQGRGVLDGNVRDTGVMSIQLVPSGPVPPRPGELLASENMTRALEEARGRADVVLIDSAPIMTAGDAAHLLSQVDGVLLVARAGKTTTGLAERTSELLQRLKAPVVGVALNAVKDAVIPRGYYRRPRGQSDATQPKRSKRPT